MTKTTQPPGRHAAVRRGVRGAGLVEYALLVALIAMAALVAVTYLGSENSGSLDRSASRVSSVLG